MAEGQERLDWAMTTSSRSLEGTVIAGQKNTPEGSRGCQRYFSKVQVMLMMSRVMTSPDRVPVPSPRSGKDTDRAPSVRV